MNPFRLTVRSHARADIPADVGPERWLSSLVEAAVKAGTAGPAGVVLRERQIDVVELAGPRAAGIRTGWLLAGLTTTETQPGGRAEAVGVVGRHTRKHKGVDVELAMVFLEWSDCSWWLWEARLDASGKALHGAPVVSCAAEGDALPPGIGRWWSAARRAGMRVELAAATQATDTSAVH